MKRIAAALLTALALAFPARGEDSLGNITRGSSGPGHVTTGAQNFAGAKTFLGGLLSDTLQSAGATAVTLTSSMPDGVTARASIINTTTPWTAAGSKLLSLQTNGVEMAYFDHTGSLYSLGILGAVNGEFSDGVSVDQEYRGTTTGPVRLLGRTGDGASAVQHILDCMPTMATAGAKLVSVRNNTTEKASIDKDGRAAVAAVATPPVFNAPTNGGSFTPDAAAAGFWVLTAGSGVASFTVNNPTNPVSGQRAVFVIANSSGGVLTVTFGTAFLNDDGVGTLSVPDTKRRSVEFIYSASTATWILVGSPSGSLSAH